MKRIEQPELSQYGMETLHHLMDNGERRFRLRSSDGSSYIRTEASDDSGWQKSHYHKTLQELYLVQKGWVLLAELRDENLTIKKYEENEFFISEPMIPHNIFMGPYAVTHTIKYGNGDGNDWNASEELDRLLQEVNR